MKKYYKGEDLKDGIWKDGIQIIPPFSKTLLRNLRFSKRITYQKIGNECAYTIDDLQNYLNSTKVVTKKSRVA